jgi:signal transduction histidine kinase
VPNAANNDQFASITWKIPLLTGLLGLLSLLIIAYGFYSGNRITTLDAPLVRAAMRIKLEAATTDIVLETLLDGALVAGLETIWNPVDHALQEFRAIHDKGTQKRLWLPYVGTQIRPEEIQALESGLLVLKDLAGRRMTRPRGRLVDDASDRLYREGFNQFMSQADNVEKKLHQAMARNLTRFRYSQGTLIGICALLTLTASVTLQRIERRRVRAFRNLQQAKTQLDQEVIERKHSEARKTQILQELKDYSYTISHDLRAPLISLKGFAGEIRLSLDELKPLVRQAADPKKTANSARISAILDQDLPEAVDYIDAASGRMERLLEAMRKLSRLGRRELSPERLNVNAVVAETLNSLAYAIKSRKIEVSVADLPETVADSVSMEEIFANLLSNAVNYLDPQRPGRVWVDGENHSGETIYRVSDNGRGIQPGDIEKIFNMFERLGQNDMPGEGMGLSYVRSLVRRHGGTVTCESQPGTGSTFTFSISRRMMVGED